MPHLSILARIMIRLGLQAPAYQEHECKQLVNITVYKCDACLQAYPQASAAATIDAMAANELAAHASLQVCVKQRPSHTLVNLRAMPFSRVSTDMRARLHIRSMFVMTHRPISLCSCNAALWCTLSYLGHLLELSYVYDYSLQANCQPWLIRSAAAHRAHGVPARLQAAGRLCGGRRRNCR